MRSDVSQLAGDRPAADWIPPGYTAPVSIENYTGPAPTDENDDDVTASTVRLMSDISIECASSARIRSGAQEIQAQIHTGALRKFESARLAWQYADDRVTFIGDEQAIVPFDFHWQPDELLIHPDTLLSMTRPRDDCDGFSMLIASLLIALDVPCGFVTIAANKELPRRYSHVYVYAETERGKIPLDASHGPAPGYEHRPWFKRREWPIMIHPQQRASLQGIGDFNWNVLSTGAMDLAKGILIPRFGTPAAGTKAYYDAKGQLREVSTFPGGGATLDLTGGDGATSWLVIGGIAIAVLLVVTSRK